MRRVDTNAQLWFSRLQSAAAATQVGYFLYSTPTFYLSMHVQTATDIVKEEHNLEVEVLLMNEAAFESPTERKN
eukprot:6482822-Ditylum_brightwellii.AAC.1